MSLGESFMDNARLLCTSAEHCPAAFANFSIGLTLGGISKSVLELKEVVTLRNVRRQNWDRIENGAKHFVA